MRRYVLSVSTLGLGLDDHGKRGSVRLPAGAKITVLDPVPVLPPENPVEMVSVLWNGRGVLIFLADLQERGLLVQAAQAHGHSHLLGDERSPDVVQLRTPRAS
jgi:hypothetical protein